jgi:hypothetical protein
MDVRAVSEPADRVVRAFLVAVAQLQNDLPAAAGVDTVADLIRQTRKRQIPREGKLGNGVEYAVHGAGCRFTTTASVEIDVDIDHDAPVFDAWRLSNFADSDPGLGEPSLAELNAAAQRLVAAGELREVRPGWYTP